MSDVKQCRRKGRIRRDRRGRRGRREGEEGGGGGGGGKGGKERKEGEEREEGEEGKERKEGRRGRGEGETTTAKQTESYVCMYHTHQRWAGQLLHGSALLPASSALKLISLPLAS